MNTDTRPPIPAPLALLLAPADINVLARMLKDAPPAPHVGAVFSREREVVVIGLMFGGALTHWLVAPAGDVETADAMVELWRPTLGVVAELLGQHRAQEVIDNAKRMH